MRITRIDTLYWKNRDQAPWWPHWTWVRLHTDTGLTALGETCPRSSVAIQGSCQRFYESDWPAMLRIRLCRKMGSVTAPDLPGFGLKIKEAVWQHPAAIIQTSKI
jgi:L-alanine-DL-glutamate epimerase-like enolase superfamily enzyme